MKCLKFATQMVNEASDSRLKAKAFANYCLAKSRIMSEVAEFLSYVYQYGVPQHEEDQLPSDYWYTPVVIHPIGVVGVDESYEVPTSVILPLSEIARAISSLAQSDEPDTAETEPWDTEYIVDCHDFLMNSFPGAVDVMLGRGLTSKIDMPYPCKIPGLEGYDDYTSTISLNINIWRKMEGLKIYFNIETKPRYQFSVVDLLDSVYGSYTQCGAVSTIVHTLAASDSADYGSIVSAITSQLGSMADRAIEKTRDMIQIAADQSTAVINRLELLCASICENFTSGEDAPPFDDTDDFSLENYLDYTGTPASAYWNASMATGAFNSAVAITKTTISTLWKIGESAVKQIFKFGKRAWTKYVKPAYQSKDFADSGNEADAPYCDVPLFIAGSGNDPIFYDPNAMFSSIQNYLIEESTSDVEFRRPTINVSLDQTKALVENAHVPFFTRVVKDVNGKVANRLSYSVIGTTDAEIETTCGLTDYKSRFFPNGSSFSETPEVDYLDPIINVITADGTIKYNSDVIPRDEYTSLKSVECKLVTFDADGEVDARGSVTLDDYQNLSSDGSIVPQLNNLHIVGSRGTDGYLVVTVYNEGRMWYGFQTTTKFHCDDKLSFDDDLSYARNIESSREKSQGEMFHYRFRGISDSFDYGPSNSETFSVTIERKGEWEGDKYEYERLEFRFTLDYDEPTAYDPYPAIRIRCTAVIDARLYDPIAKKWSLSSVKNLQLKSKSVGSKISTQVSVHHPQVCCLTYNIDIRKLRNYQYDRSAMRMTFIPSGQWISISINSVKSSSTGITYARPIFFLSGDESQYVCGVNPFATWASGWAVKTNQVKPALYNCRYYFSVEYKYDGPYILSQIFSGYADYSASGMIVSGLWSKSAPTYYDHDQSVQSEWLSDTLGRLHSIKLGQLTDEALQELVKTVNQPVDVGCVLTQQLSFLSYEISAGDKFDDSGRVGYNMVAHLSPIVCNTLFKDDGSWRISYTSTGLRYLDPITNSMRNISESDLADMILQAVKGDVNAASDRYLDEIGDVNACRDLIHAANLTDLFLYCIDRPFYTIESYFSDGYESDRYILKTGKVSLPSGTTQVNNLEIVQACSVVSFDGGSVKQTLTAQNLASIVHNLLHLVITNKLSYMRVFYAMTGKYPDFFPYLIGDRLPKPRYHVTTDAEVASYVERVMTVAIIASFIIAAMSVKVIATAKFKKFTRRKLIEKRVESGSNTSKAMQEVNRIEKDKANLDGIAEQLKDNDLDDVTREGLMNQRDALLTDLKDAKNSLSGYIATADKLNKAERRWTKIASRLGIPIDMDIWKNVEFSPHEDRKTQFESVRSSAGDEGQAVILDEIMETTRRIKVIL